MNHNKSNYHEKIQNIQTVNQSDKLAIIAGVISTIGDALATLATILAVEEASQSNDVNSDNKNLQKQIDYLIAEQEKLKRQLYNNNN